MQELIFTPSPFYTKLDEKLLLEWLDFISSIASHKTIHTELHVNLDTKLTDEDLLEMVAICDRYGLSKSQLTPFIHEQNQFWSYGPKFQVIYPQLNKEQKETLDTDSNLIRLECMPVDLYTQLDKNNMFEWMERISSVKNIIGLGPVIHLYVDVNRITEQDISELMGLFNRYNFDVEQLAVLKHKL